MVLHKPNKKAINCPQRRILISVTVLGSAGPIRFVVNEDELVAAVIGTVLKNYAREGRLPVLGSDFNEFVLYCPSIPEMEALSPSETIGSFGARNFKLWKKPHVEKANAAAAAKDEEDDKRQPIDRKRNNNWSWKTLLLLMLERSCNPYTSEKVSCH
ncbi:uncharacterized protein At4g22758-like [Diospyros lotus]|uniref:uncharacterized protein At4g22758-like n=1 Tax=Diospyros lotus TaxID=55363 RepID=UPI00225B54BE|nr:uncharacterized protein At4g22758-like [Diospyros lotus]